VTRVAESAPQADTRSTFVIRITVAQHCNGFECRAGLSAIAELLVLFFTLLDLWRIQHRINCEQFFYSARSLASVKYWMKSGTVLHYRRLAMQAEFGRDQRSINSWRARRNFVFFCQVSKARCHRFPVDPMSRNLHTTHRSVSQWKFSEQNFANLTVRGRFAKNAKNFQNGLTCCDFRRP